MEGKTRRELEETLGSEVTEQLFQWSEKIVEPQVLVCNMHNILTERIRDILTKRYDKGVEVRLIAKERCVTSERVKSITEIGKRKCFAYLETNNFGTMMKLFSLNPLTQEQFIKVIGEH